MQEREEENISNISLVLKKHNLVNIKELYPKIRVDLKYASEDNFTGEIVYDFSECYLLLDAANALIEVQKDLELLGLSLKIWDAYRPMCAQEKFWSIFPDERYVSHPQKGGRHTRGTAVDLTLCSEEGFELEMPSPFDEFSSRAHRNNLECSFQALQNRNLLEDYMQKHGFLGLSTEWWHFDLENWESFPVIESLLT